jgi:M6 family metalloprotease-like protein
MNRLCVTLLVFLLALSSFSLAQHNHPHATPPAPYAIKVTQPDGSQLEVIARGDENRNWMETTDGYSVVKTSRGTFEYAVKKQGKLMGSGIIAQNPGSRNSIQIGQLSQIKKGLAPTSSTKTVKDPFLQPFRSNTAARLGAAGVMPASGDVKVLAILIEYPDLKHSYEKEEFEKFFNGPSNKPTFKSYFKENSHGKFIPNVEVVGWYQAKNNFDYYGEEHGKARARELVSEAIAAADADGVDFSRYNNNGDSYVDGIIVIHAGQGAEEASQKEYIWSHRWTISPKFADGAFVRDYTIQPEVRVRYGGPELVRLGIFCHEFGHLLGLPDLYDTDTSDDDHHGIGEWGLMGLGGWIGDEEYPAGMSAFSKAMLGWGNVEDITNQGGSYELKPAHSDGKIYMIKTPNSNEYFLLENRQQSGFDRFLNGKGLAIWHINTEKTERYPESIHVNNRKDRKGVDLEEADGNDDLDRKRNRGDAGDLFPGSKNRIIFDATSDPNSDLYDDLGKGKGSKISIANIKLSGTTITFDYNKPDDKGTECDQAVAAKEGDNTLPKTDYWYSFTMPEAGRLVVTGANAAIYRNCDDDALVSSKDGKLTTEWLDKGDALKIKFVDSQPKALPLTWKLSVETQKADPQLKVDAVADKTYGDAPFEIKVSRAGEGAINIEKVSGLISINGTKVSISGAGEAKVKVKVSETSQYAASEKEVSFTINKAKPVLSFEEIGDKTYGDEPFDLKASATPNLPITFKVLSGEATLRNATLSLQRAGRVEIEASVIGNENYLSAKTSQEFEVRKASQSITFAPLEDEVYEAGKKITLTAQSDQELPVSFSVKSGKVVLDGATLTIQGAGEVTIEALQAGNDNILAASPVVRSFEITKASQVVTFAEIDTKSPSDDPFSLEANSSAGIPMEYRVVSGNATLNGSVLAITGSGEVVVEAYNEGNENYEAVAAQQSFVVAEPDKLTQTLSVASLPDTVNVGDEIDLDITLSSGLNPVIDLNGQVVREEQKLIFNQAGEVTLTVSQPGNDQYNPAPSFSHTFTVINTAVVETPLGTTEQTLSIDPVTDLVYGVEPFSLGVNSSSELPVTYQVEGPAQIQNGIVTVTGAGVVTVQAHQAGNQDFAPSDTVVMSFMVEKAPQTITLEIIPLGSNTYQIRATSDADLPVALEVTEGVGTIEGDKLTVLESGSVIVVANQEGNENFVAAEPVSRVLEVEIITSIGEEAGLPQIKMYPNPSAGLFQIEFPITEKELHFQVFDLTGSRVKQGALSNAQTTIDLTEYRSGTYVVQIQTSAGLQQHRLIKQ